MIAFFDTNIYVDYLRGTMPAPIYLRYFQTYIIRLSPIVYHELLRGVRAPKVAKRIRELEKKVRFLPAPTPTMWAKAGELLSQHFPQSEKTLEQMQNDMLIALTARHTGATLITRDTDFQRLQTHIQFPLLMHYLA